MLSAQPPENSSNPFLRVFIIIAVIAISAVLAAVTYMLVGKNSQQTIQPTPTPLPPFYIKKIDTANKSGEFILSNPTPGKQSESLTKQILINGTYQVDNKKITIQASIQNSSIPIHPMPPGFTDSSAIPLTLKMIVDNTVYYETDMPLTNSENANIIPFKIRLPFYSPVTIKIYRESQEIYSQTIQL